MRREALVAMAVVALVGAPAAQAKPGDLDTGFGSNGIVDFITPSGHTIGAGAALALQPDGKIVVAGQDTAGSGSVLVERFNRDGQRDASFGDHGVVLTDFGLDDERPALALRPDGRLIVAGRHTDGSNREYAVVVQYLPDGRIDDSFGSHGEVARAGPGAQSIALDGSGRLVVGTRDDGNVGTQIFRLLGDGAIDHSFGSSGTTTLQSPAGAVSVAIQPDGRIVLGGNEITRLESNGAPDQSFGDHGTATLPQGGGAVFDAVVQKDGRIVAAGATTPSPYEMKIWRVMPGGSPDSSFGSGGAVTVAPTPGRENYNPPQNMAQAVAVQDDGAITATGLNLDGDRGAPTTLETVRLTPAGELDPAFGSGGTVLTPLQHVMNGSANSIASQPDGNVVIAGYGVGEGTGHIVLARYRSGPSQTGSPPAQGAPAGGSSSNAPPATGSGSGPKLVRLYIASKRRQRVRRVRTHGLTIEIRASKRGRVTLSAGSVRRTVRVAAGRPKRVVLRPRTRAGMLTVHAKLVGDGVTLARGRCRVRLIGTAGTYLKKAA